MDSSQLAVAALAVLLASVYVALVILTPAPLATVPDECTFTSATSPDPAPLPRTTPDTKDATLALSVVVPAFNESLRLGEMISEALTHLAKTPNRTFEVIIVDDGSADDTARVALDLSKQHHADSKVDIRVIRLLRNRGKGGAVQHGMLHARGKRLLMVDADGASRFSDLDELWLALDKLEFTDPAQKSRAIAIGSRAHLVGSAAVVKRSAVRNALMYSFHFILKTLGVGYIRDTQCGFKLFTRSAAYQLFSSQHLPTWIFDVEILLLARQLGIPVAEIPIHWHEVAGSKLRLLNDSVGMLRDLLVLRANYATGRWRPKALP